MADSAYKHIKASVIATCIAEIVTLPLCALKTNYQNVDGKTIVATLKSLWKNYGIKGFYNASAWAISSQILSTASKYTLYRKIQHSSPNKFIAGAIAGFIGSIMTHPFDVLKIHFQTHNPFMRELRKEGIKLFYRGYSKSFAKAVGGSMLFLPLYDTFNDYFLANKYLLSINTSTSVIAGMSAISSSVISTTLIQPIDYMKTRHVMNHNYKHVVPGTLSLKHFKPYFKGLSLNLLRVVPHFFITMTAIKVIEDRL